MCSPIGSAGQTAHLTFTVVVIFSSQSTPSARSGLVCVLRKQTCWLFWRKTVKWKGPQYVAVSIRYWLVTCLQVFFCTGNYMLFNFSERKLLWVEKHQIPYHQYWYQYRSEGISIGTSIENFWLIPSPTTYGSEQCSFLAYLWEYIDTLDGLPGAQSVP